MSSVIQNPVGSSTQYLLSEGWREPRWYAIQIRARHEKKVDMRLQASQICTFLPIVRQIHRWSDRLKVIELPLFSCYLFVHIISCAKIRSIVLHTDGVVGFVGAAGEGTPVQDAEIRDISLLLKSGTPFNSYPFLQTGRRVRIRGGSLDGIEGTLVNSRNDRKVVVSVELIQRSVAITVQGYDIEAV